MNKFLQTGIATATALILLFGCSEESINQSLSEAQTNSEETNKSTKLTEVYLAVDKQTNSFVVQNVEDKSKLLLEGTRFFLRISPDGKKAIMPTANGIELFTANGVETLKTLYNSQIPVFQWASDSNSFIKPSRETLDKFDLTTKETSPIESVFESGKVFSFSPDLSKIAFKTNIDTPNSDYYVKVLDLKSKEFLSLNEEVYRPELPPIWSPDGTQLAFQAKDGRAAIFNPDGKEIKTLLTKGVPLLWSPDGSNILLDDTAAKTNRIVIENLERSAQLRLNISEEDQDKLRRISLFSPDSSKILFSSSSGTIIFDLQTGQKVSELENEVSQWLKVDLSIFNEENLKELKAKYPSS